MGSGGGALSRGLTWPSLVSNGSPWLPGEMAWGRGQVRGEQEEASAMSWGQCLEQGRSPFPFLHDGHPSVHGTITLRGHDPTPGGVLQVVPEQPMRNVLRLP